MRCFTEAIAIDALHLAAQEHRFHLLADDGRHAEAIDAGVLLLAHGLAGLGLLRRLAELLLGTGKPMDAIEVARRALVQNPADPRAQVCVARGLGQLGRDDEAWEAWRRVVEDAEAMRDPDALSWELEAASALERRSVEAARVRFRELLERRSEHLLGMADRRFAQALQSSEAARSAFRAFLDLRRSDRSVLARASHVWLVAGDAEAAVDAAQQWVGLEPRSAQGWFSVAEGLVAAGRAAEAIAAYERALTIWPDFIGAKARLAVVRGQLAR